MNNIEELLLDWDTPKTFKELPYRHIMPECTVTIDEPEKRGLDELLSNIRHRINNKVKSIRKGMER
jgi:hypothetical protein